MAQYTVNGEEFDWASLEAKLPGGTTAVGLQSITYTDSKSREPVYGQGSTPVGFAEGNYSAEGQLSMLRRHADEFEAALFAQSSGRGVLAHKPIEITCNYANADQPLKTDVLKKVLITKRDYQAKQGDLGLVVTYDMKIIGGIFRNGVRPA